MSQAPAVPGSADGGKQQLLFWGCFIALITTAFAFIARMFLINTWADEFGLDPAQAGRLAGIGIWPFAVSIIGFSLIIDKIGYKTAMTISFVGYVIWSIMGVSAFYISKEGNTDTAYQLIYWGSLILGLSNGTVEAYINPVVATIFNKEKTKWLNILHAGWPGGLVLAGIITILMDDLVGGVDWSIKVGILAIPAVIFFIMLLPCKFPAQEREAAGVSYRDMLGEFGVLSALVVGFLVTLQLMDFFNGMPAFSVTDGSGNVVLSDAGQPSLTGGAKGLFIGIGVAIVVAFGVYTRRMGRPILFFLSLIMIPLATTEIGTDGWITGIMEDVFENIHAGWILVYTSLIMMVLRFFAGPIVHKFSPLGLLAISAVLAIIGLATLSFTTGFLIFVAATLYGFGKTFFWPTMLGVVSEQTPKGGALTLNAIGGIGMLAVGTLGFPYIGTLQADRQIDAIVEHEDAKKVTGLVKDGKLTTLDDKSIYEILKYQDINNDALNKAIYDSLDDDPKELAEITKKRADDGDPVKPDEIVLSGEEKKVGDAFDKARGESNQKALMSMAVFPGIMLVCYLALIGYFKSKGGYKAVHLDAGEDQTHPSHDDAAAGEVVDKDVRADEAIADGQVGPSE